MNQEQASFMLATTQHKSQKMWQQIVTTKCHYYKLSEQIVTTNESKISSISDTFIYFPHGKLCKCTWNESFES